MSFYEIFISTDSIPDNAYGSLQLCFLLLVYLLLVGVGSYCLSVSIDYFSLLPYSQGKIGSIIMPIVSQFPDIALVIVSCTGRDPQDRVDVAVGGLAGGIFMLLCFLLTFVIYVGHGVIVSDTGVANLVDDRSCSVYSSYLRKNGIPVSKPTQHAAYLMLLTSVVFLFMLVPNSIYEKDNANVNKLHDKYFALCGFLTACGLFFYYLYDTWLISKQNMSVYLSIDDYPASSRALSFQAQPNSIGSRVASYMLRCCGPTEGVNIFNGSNSIGRDHFSEQTALLQKELPLNNILIALCSIMLPEQSNFQANDPISLRVPISQVYSTFYSIASNETKDNGERTDTNRQESGINSSLPCGLKTVIDHFKTKNGTISLQDLAEGVYSIVTWCASNSREQEAGRSLLQELSTVHLLTSLDAQQSSEKFNKFVRNLLPEKLTNKDHVDSTVLRKAAQLRALLMFTIGSILIGFIMIPLVDVIDEIGDRMGIGSYYVSFVVTPPVSDLSAILSIANRALERTEESLSTCTTAVLSSVSVNNTVYLGLVLFFVFIQGLEWFFLAETVSVLLIEGLVVYLCLQCRVLTLQSGVALATLYLTFLGITILMKQYNLTD